MDASFIMVVIYSILDAFGIIGLSLVTFIILIIIGLIIVLFIRLFLILVPAVIVATIVYFLTGGDLFWTGLAFLIVAALSLITRV